MRLYLGHTLGKMGRPKIPKVHKSGMILSELGPKKPRPERNQPTSTRTASCAEHARLTTGRLLSLAGADRVLRRWSWNLSVMSVTERKARHIL
jgi:hypothetical protein